MREVGILEWEEWGILETREMGGEIIRGKFWECWDKRIETNKLGFKISEHE